MYNFSNNKYTGRKKLFDYEKLLNNSAEQAKKATDKAELLGSTLAPKNSFNGKTAAKPTMPGPISSDNVAELLSFDLPSGLKKNESKNPRNSGAIIKQRLAKFLSNSTGKDYSKAFDSIDDRLVEKNIPLADDTVQKNTSKRAYHGDYPNMRDGMALFYAASEANDSKTAKLARQVAYSESKSDNALNTKSLSDNTNDTKSHTSSWIDALKDIHKDIKSASEESENNNTQIKNFDEFLKLYSNFYERIKDNNDFQIRQYLNHALKTGKFSEEELISKLGPERYVGVEKALLYRTPRRGTEVKAEVLRGEEVEFTGKKVVNNRGIEMAEVVYNGVTGWIEADALKYSKKVANDKNADKSFLDYLSGNFVSGLYHAGDTINRFIDYVSHDEAKATKNYRFNKTLDLSKTGAMKGEYIDKQKYLEEFRIGNSNIKDGGCGVIAMYNVLVGLDHKINFARLIYDNEDNALLDATFGTSPIGIKNALSKYGFEVTEEYDVNEKTDISDCDAVIHLYFYGARAHYVAGISDGKGRFYFYNDSDVKNDEPLYWDEYLPMVSNGTWNYLLLKIKKRSK